MIRFFTLLIMICLGLASPHLEAANENTKPSTRSASKSDLIGLSHFKKKIPTSKIYIESKTSQRISANHLATFQTKEAEYICLFNDDQDLTLIFVIPKNQSADTLNSIQQSQEKIAQIFDATACEIKTCGTKSYRFYMIEFAKAKEALELSKAKYGIKPQLKSNPLNLIFYLCDQYAMPIAWASNRPVWEKYEAKLYQSIRIYLNINYEILQTIDFRCSAGSIQLNELITTINEKFNLKLANIKPTFSRYGSKTKEITDDTRNRATFFYQKDYFRVINKNAPFTIKREPYTKWIYSDSLQFPSKLTDLDELLANIKKPADEHTNIKMTDENLLIKNPSQAPNETVEAKASQATAATKPSQELEISASKQAKASSKDAPKTSSELKSEPIKKLNSKEAQLKYIEELNKC